MTVPVIASFLAGTAVGMTIIGWAVNYTRWRDEGEDE